jgi:hypothetical protein
MKSDIRVWLELEVTVFADCRNCLKSRTLEEVGSALAHINNYVKHRVAINCDID